MGNAPSYMRTPHPRPLSVPERGGVTRGSECAQPKHCGAEAVGMERRVAPPTHLARRLRREQTPAEQVLWELVRNRRLAGLKFRRQQPIGPFVADFCCHEASVVVEVDGLIHCEHGVRDAERDAWLTTQGFQVLRFTNELVLSHPRQVYTSIVCAVKQRLTNDTPRV